MWRPKFHMTFFINHWGVEVTFTDCWILDFTTLFHSSSLPKPTSIISNVLINFFFIVLGVIWPVEGMPILLRYVSYCLPLTMATTSLRSILTRGWNLLEPDVYLGFISTISWIVLFLSISMAVLKFKRG